MSLRSLALASITFAPLALMACSSDSPAPFVPKRTIESVAADPLAGTGVESCGVYQEEQCMAGKKVRCDLYDARAKSWVDLPDPLLRRVYLYDRWYDRFESPMGLTAERVFTGAMPHDAPEAVWTSSTSFAGWTGTGDAGIWTGAALVSDIFRYATTRTEADYQRMEAKTKDLVRSFEVTGIPGYLSRYHFLKVPPGTPQNEKLILRTEETSPTQLPIDDRTIDGLPAEYRDGVDDGHGGKVAADAYWDGDVSIDQYTGPMTAFPIVYPLLRDEALKAKIVHHMTCYLKRLQRIEIKNLKARPDLVDAIKNLFGGSTLKLDPDDPDISELTELVWFVHRGINVNNAATFDKTCPDTLPYQAGRVLDAKSPTIESELLELATDINRDIRTRPNQIDHFYIVSIRGGDASHLMHLALMAYLFTGEEQYEKFLREELVGKLRTNDVARTMMAFRQPDWCFRFYGDHITYGTHWQLVTMLPDGPLKDEMKRVMQEEIWEKGLFNHRSAKFGTMYASVMDRPERAGIVEMVLDQLARFGGNGGTQDAPRRTYSRDRAAAIAALPAGVTTRCPTEEDRHACEDGGSLFGFPLEGSTISYTCDGRPGECMMADGKCTEALASSGLPADQRNYADFMWQRSPFDLGETFGLEGQVQSPGRDLTEPYWMARYYGLETNGADQVLAWRETGTCTD